MAIRRSYMMRFLFLAAVCGIVIVGLHFYMYIYKGSNHSDRFPSPSISSWQSPTEGSFSSAIRNAFEGTRRQDSRKDPRRHLKHKIVHFDLKGMPPLVEAFKELFKFLNQLGVTGVLMEYEDMFPYQGTLAGITNRKSYTPSDIRKILAYAKASHLQVIPLVQTFGHLEFVLKLQSFMGLREVPKYPQVICPTNNQSKELVKEMLQQVLNLHPDIEYLHIGSDEVYHIGVCPLCQNRMEKSSPRVDEAQLFLQHVKSVAQYVRDTYHVQPVMWDDEFRKLDEATIRESGIGNLVEIIVWNYHYDVDYRLEPSMWQKYSRLFKSIWIGSAFKGAEKPNSVIVNETLYLGNHYSWVKTMEDVQSVVSFKGIFLTGWQRYDHFSVLCEIFTSAIPSLVSCMTYLNTLKKPTMEAILSNASAYLDCGSRFNFCNFPGSDVYQDILQLDLYQDAFKRIQEKNVFMGWAQDINLQLEFSNPSHVESVFQEISSLKGELDRSQMQLGKSLRNIYPEWSVKEWMLTNFQPLYKKVNSLNEGLSKILDKRVFPVRPLDFELPSASSQSSPSVTK